MPKPSPQESYRQCAQALARGATVNSEWKAETLRAAGKSERELTSDVARARETLQASGGASLKIKAVPPRGAPLSIPCALDLQGPAGSLRIKSR
jgi:hypothetical protein